MIESSVQSWTFRNRSDWGKGPWNDENIDKKVWVDKSTGLDCMIHRNHSGSWCGYAAVKPGHPLYGRDYNNYEDLIDLHEVHGGLTFSGGCHGMNEDGSGICHPADDGQHVWWFGFDCSHCFDLSPINYGGGADSDYRDESYVTEQVTLLAKLIAATSNK